MYHGFFHSSKNTTVHDKNIMAVMIFFVLNYLDITIWYNQWTMVLPPYVLTSAVNGEWGVSHHQNIHRKTSLSQDKLLSINSRALSSETIFAPIECCVHNFCGSQGRSSVDVGKPSFPPSNHLCSIFWYPS